MREGNASPNRGGNIGGRPPEHFRGATATPRTDAGTTNARRDGSRYEVGARGQVTHYSKPGVDARFTEQGTVSRAHVMRPDHSEINIRRSPQGYRRVEVVRPDHTRIVSMGRNHGYYERHLATRPGYVSRTYVMGGRTYVRVYRSYYYRNIAYYRYVPRVYYGPVFYGWAYDPWRAPVAYTWGWNTEPWYGYYGPYFAPAPAYVSASAWLTDYLIAENLRLAYENRLAVQRMGENFAEQPVSATNSGGITPEVRLAIAEQVKQQLAEERTLAGQTTALAPNVASGEEVPPALDPKQRVFVVSTNLDVTADGQECGLSPGDVLLRTGDAVEEGNKVAMSVLSSKTGNCQAGARTAIEVAEMQEMHNHFREKLGSGLKILAENQGTGGLPVGPAADPREVAEGKAAPDLVAMNQLMKQQAEADEAETNLQRAASEE